MDTLSAPDWRKSTLCGALFALAHFTKASALPALLLFASSYGVLFLCHAIRRELAPALTRDLILRALLPVAVFLVLLSPYLLESKAKYGSYFYNVNTTFYIWYDSWTEAKAGPWPRAITKAIQICRRKKSPAFKNTCGNAASQ